MLTYDVSKICNGYSPIILVIYPFYKRLNTFVIQNLSETGPQKLRTQLHCKNSFVCMDLGHLLPWRIETKDCYIIQLRITEPRARG